MYHSSVKNKSVVHFQGHVVRVLPVSFNQILPALIKRHSFSLLTTVPGAIFTKLQRIKKIEMLKQVLGTKVLMDISFYGGVVRTSNFVVIAK
jgi:hypothetical protein